MITLNQLEVNVIMTEADRLMRNFPSWGLGQAIWNCCDDQFSNLTVDLRNKLYFLLDSDRTTEYDFYHWTDYYELMNSFYDRYVGD